MHERAFVALEEQQLEISSAYCETTGVGGCYRSPRYITKLHSLVVKYREAFFDKQKIVRALAGVELQ